MLAGTLPSQNLVPAIWLRLNLLLLVSVMSVLAIMLKDSRLYVILGTSLFKLAHG